MLDFKKVAITGGVASGKSTVCKFFKELGAYVISADALSHELLDPNTDLGKQILQDFGKHLLQNGQISRKLLGEKVFKDHKALHRLEELLHPAVLKKIEEHAKKAQKEHYCLIVVEFPLLFEIGYEKNFDIIINVLADEEAAKSRFEQSGFQKLEYDLRMSRQLDPKIKASRSDYTIQNTGSLEDLKEKVVKLNKIIQNQ